MGGGFELALACHYRIASDSDKTRIGLPEIKVGLFPGGGGTQRVARLMPTPDALQLLLKGDHLRPAVAKKMGLVHEVAPADQIVALAKAWVKANPNAKAPWDDPKFKLPSGKVFSPQGMMIWPPANAIYRRETYDNYPAAKAMLKQRVRGPAAADGSGARGREQILRQHPALEGGGGDDPIVASCRWGSSTRAHAGQPAFPRPICGKSEC